MTNLRLWILSMDSASILYLSVTRLDMHLYSTVHLAQAANLMVHKVVCTVAQIIFSCRYTRMNGALYAYPKAIRLHHDALGLMRGLTKT